MIRRYFFIIAGFLVLCAFASNTNSLKIARLKYDGGGNWYVSPTSLPNLITFCNKNLGTNLAATEDVVEPGSKDIFNYPFIHITGNGAITFTDAEAQNMRNYLIAGGFLNVND